MQTLATLILGSLAVVLLLHFMEGGTAQSKLWAGWLVTGKGPYSG